MNQQTIDKRRDLIRTMIESAGGRFAAVTFVKKDGTERTMQVQPAANKFHVLGAAAAPSAQQAAETRAINNPHLYNVWDVAKQAWRSINLDTVTQISVNGAIFKVNV